MDPGVRTFSIPFLNDRQDDWREGLGAALTNFGGVPRTILGDNARAPVAVGALGRPAR